MPTSARSNSPTPASGTGSNSTGSANSNGSTSGSTNAKSIGGIQMPALQHNFIVRIEGTPQDFSNQSVAFAMNFAKKELLMIVEQSLTANTREHVVIQDMIDNPDRTITFDIMNPSTGAPNDTIKFHDCVIEDHAVDFNYAASGAVVHILVWSYDQIELANNKAQTAFASAMSVIGKP
jgi:hypothetical protein